MIDDEIPAGERYTHIRLNESTLKTIRDDDDDNDDDAANTLATRYKRDITVAE